MSGTIDKFGKTEEQFLRDYDITQYFRPSVTVDAVLCAAKPSGGRVLLIRRGGHPFIEHFAFPGGFVDEHEPCEAAVVRELTEETGIVGLPLRQLVSVSTPGRDPRWRNITVVFYATVDKDIAAVGGDDASLASWFDFTVTEKGDEVNIKFTDGTHEFDTELKVVRDSFGIVDINNTRITKRGLMAFDHAKVVYYLYDSIIVKRG